MSAILSPCGLYRYRLERDVGMEGPVFAFFGVNPSTADATLDDATVRKWTGFVKRWGGRRFIVGNVFAYRATDVRELAQAADPIGPENIRHLQDIVAEADVLVPCWGNRSKMPQQLRHRLAIVKSHLWASGKPVRCFGFTMSGDPLHPLMLGYDTPLIDWRGCPFCGGELFVNDDMAERYVRLYGAHYEHPDNGCWLSGKEVGPSNVASWNSRTCGVAKPQGDKA